MSAHDPSFLRTTGRILHLSGILAAVGIVFLVGMFAAFAAGSKGTGQTLGLINDTLVLASYLLVAPAVVALAGLAPTRPPVIGSILALAGLAGIAWVVVWQGLLIAGILTFEQQIGPVTVGYLVLAVWFVAAGHLASRSGAFSSGGRMGLVAATYVGYPIWAIWIGRHFRRLGAPSSSQPLPATAE